MSEHSEASPSIEEASSALRFTKSQIALLSSQKGPSRRIPVDEDFPFLDVSTPPVLTGGSGLDLECDSDLDDDPAFALSACPLLPEYWGSLQHAKWDWYQSTVWLKDPHAGLVQALLAAWPLSDWCAAAPLNRVYQYGGVIRRGSQELCRLSWGGQPGINCKTSSSDSGALCAALRGFDHSPTRLDACLDWTEEGLFDSLSNALRQFGLKRRIKLGFAGDWERNEGRTLYLGGKQSIVQICLYEKGAEQRAKGVAGAPLDWVRLEVRVGNMKRKQRDRIAHWDHASNVFSVGWMPEACAAIGLEALETISLGTSYSKSTDERAFLALLNQYGPLLKRLAGESSDGWDTPLKRLVAGLDPHGDVPYSGPREVCERPEEEAPIRPLKLHDATPLGPPKPKQINSLRVTN